MNSQLPPDESRREALLITLWTQIGVGSFFMILRLWARWLRRSFGLDDLVMTVAWLVYIGDAVAIQFYAETGTRHALYLTPPELSYDLMVSLIIQAISIPCTGLGKISIGLTLLRIVGPSQRWERWVILFIIYTTALTVVVNVALSLFRCGNPRALWDFALAMNAKCLNAEATAHFNVFTSAWQAFSDFIFSALPVPIVWRLNMPYKRKLFIITALGLTLITAAAATTKTVLLAMVSPEDPTWDVFGSLVWFSTEVLLIVICGAVPALTPLWDVIVKRFWPGHRKPTTSIRLTDENGTYGTRGTQGTQSSRISRLKIGRLSTTQHSHHHKGESTYSLELAQITAQISGVPYNPNNPPVWISASPDDRGSWANNANNGRHIRVVNEINITTESTHDPGLGV